MNLQDASSEKRPHLLLVADNRQVAAILTRYLEHHGLRCTSSSTVAARTEVTAQRAPDLVLLDLGIPGKDGLALMDQISHKLPVIIVSGRGESVDRIAALALGADDYMDKPFELRELLARIQVALRRRHGSAPSRVCGSTPASECLEPVSGDERSSIFSEELTRLETRAKDWRMRSAAQDLARSAELMPRHDRCIIGQRLYWKPVERPC